MFSSRELLRPGLRGLLRPLTTQPAPTETAAVHSITLPKPPVTATSPSQSIKKHGAPKPQLSVRYPYFVRRTKNGNLPVYTDTKGNGFLDVIHIQRIEGDVHVGHLGMICSFESLAVLFLVSLLSATDRGRHVETQR
jgi:hypothetical protein